MDSTLLLICINFAEFQPIILTVYAGNTNKLEYHQHWDSNSVSGWKPPSFGWKPYKGVFACIFQEFFAITWDERKNYGQCHSGALLTRDHSHSNQKIKKMKLWSNNRLIYCMETHIILFASSKITIYFSQFLLILWLLLLL